MTNLPLFQQLVTELLRNIGFELATPPEDQDMFSLSVDDNYVLHLGLMNENTWFALAELPEPVSAQTPVTDWLRLNALSDQSLQPVVALNGDDHPCCYLRLPLVGMDLPSVVAAFNAMLAQADALCGKTA